MGREIKRVAANFEWPLKQVYEGFLNPFYKFSKKCPFCGGSGYNPETKILSDTWYDTYGDGSKRWEHSITQDEVQALVDHNRLWDLTHVWSQEKGWEKKDPFVIPTAEEVNNWSREGFGHDSINHSVCVEARAKRLGVYGLCECCHGEGTIWLKPEYQKACDEWESTEPPAGDWWQMWETTSEGSPISPAFETPEELARWLTDNRASSFGSETCTYEEWLSFIKGPGWAPSAVGSSEGLMSGVAASLNLEKKE